MRRTDRQRDEKFAWQVLNAAPYATLSLVGADGTPCGVPVNAVGDETYGVIYFHCAGAGEKWEILQQNPAVCLSAVSYAGIVPGEFETAYRSAVFHGQAQVVDSEEEQMKAMLLLCTHFDPRGMGRFTEVMGRCTAKLVKIIPTVITGKEACMDKSSQIPFAQPHA